MIPSLEFSCVFTSETNGQMCLACVVTLAAFRSFSSVMRVWDTWREKNGHRYRLECRGTVAGWWCMRWGEAFINEWEDYSSIPRHLSLSLTLSLWGSITLSSSAHHSASSQTLFTGLCPWMFIDPFIFIFLRLDQRLLTLCKFPHQQIRIYPACVTDSNITEWLYASKTYLTGFEVKGLEAARSVFVCFVSDAGRWWELRDSARSRLVSLFVSVSTIRPVVNAVTTVR